MATDDLDGARILVVEDEVLIALEVADSLAAHGAVVAGPCHTLEEAISAARQDKLDLAVLDVDLGGADVFPAARILRERGIPFLFQTGRTDREALCAEFPGVPVRSKPVAPERLVADLSALLQVPA